MNETAARLIADTRILWRLLRGHPSHGDHAANLNGFYAGQAEQYDAFRERLLPGRAELYRSLALPADARLVELGAGTGANLGWLAPEEIAGCARVDLVDLCDPLLAQARVRWQGTPQVACHLADACTWQPDTPADAVVFAYSLTMMPDWRAALDNALAMLRPGGRLAIVDFTLLPEQSALARSFWKAWFGHDGVHLDASHLPTLKTLLPAHRAEAHTTHLPYLPGLTVPYYRFVGTRSAA